MIERNARIDRLILTVSLPERVVNATIADLSRIDEALGTELSASRSDLMGGVSAFLASISIRAKDRESYGALRLLLDDMYPASGKEMRRITKEALEDLNSPIFGAEVPYGLRDAIVEYIDALDAEESAQDDKR